MSSSDPADSEFYSFDTATPVTNSYSKLGLSVEVEFEDEHRGRLSDEDDHLVREGEAMLGLPSPFVRVVERERFQTLLLVICELAPVRHLLIEKVVPHTRAWSQRAPLSD